MEIVILPAAAEIVCPQSPVFYLFDLGLDCLLGKVRHLQRFAGNCDEHFSQFTDILLTKWPIGKNQ